MHGIFTIEDSDLNDIKSHAIQQYINRGGDNAIVKAYIDSVIMFLVKNGLMTNFTYNFHNLESLKKITYFEE